MPIWELTAEQEALSTNLNRSLQPTVRPSGAEAERRDGVALSVLPEAFRKAKLMKPTVIVPYSQNFTFVGRETELSRIHEHLMGSRKAHQPELRVVAIRGIGGMGKTHTALEYLYRHRRSYQGIFWIRSENTTIIQQEYAQIGRALDTKAITGMA